MASRWIWIATEVAVAAHAEQLAEHGGGVGTRDTGALDSAMARPQNLAEYGEPDVAELTAAYAFGILPVGRSRRVSIFHLGILCEMVYKRLFAQLCGEAFGYY